MADLLNKKHYLDRLQHMTAERDAYFKLWRELSEYVRPDRGRFLQAGQKKTVLLSKKILDSSGTLAVRTLASGMMAGITSPAQQWFKLEPAEQVLRQSTPVMEWIKDIQKVMMDVFARSNLYNALHTMYGELVVFGTAAMIVDEDEADILRAYPLTAGEYYLEANARQDVDTLVREITMSAEQAVRAFGAQALSREVVDLVETNKGQQDVVFIHVIEPNAAAQAGKMDAQSMPYRSVIFEKNGRDDKFARISGYREFPALCPRWSVAGSEVYGFSPGMEALPDIKQLQHEQRKKSQAIDKKVSPPLQAPTTMKQSAVNGLPGGVTFYDETRQQNGIRPTYEVNLSLADLSADIQSVQQRIGRIFYEDLFLMLASGADRSMTAREVEERHQEKLLMLGPVFERLHNELLDPLIQRGFAIMRRAGILPPPPPGFEDVEIKVEYVSVMAQAQRSAETARVERFIDFMQRALLVQPDLAQTLDLTATVADVAKEMGVEQSVVGNVAPAAAQGNPAVADGPDQAGMQADIGAAALAPALAPALDGGRAAQTADVDIPAGNANGRT